jgi:dienelactone hydrolase
MAHDGTPAAARARLVVEPADALIDVPRRIAVEGLAPGETVTLSSRTVRGPGVAWESSADFRADAAGRIDLRRDAPLPGGSYGGVSAMGLVWSQAPASPGAPREVFAAEPAAALSTEIAARRDGAPPRPAPQDTALRATLVQRLAADGVARREIREDGLVGTLFLPAGPGPHPCVLVLNGSGGGINEPRAALYASHGYAALALGYFKAPGLSDHISNTRLEIFEDALRWMRRTLHPADGFVALSGQSRGGELVLLLGTLLPDLVSAVIGYVPGAVVHSAQNACDPALGREGPAWLWRGAPLPHLWENNRTASWAPWDEGPQPRRHAHALLTALDDADAVARAAIAVENIRGPVLLLSATDDGSWPSSRYGRMVAERLARFGHPHAVRHLDFEGAGHSIVFPFVPTTQLVYAHPVSGRLSTTGGAPAANARADEASWAGVLAFLADAVRAHRARSMPAAAPSAPPAPPVAH